MRIVRRSAVAIVALVNVVATGLFMYVLIRHDVGDLWAFGAGAATTMVAVFFLVRPLELCRLARELKALELSRAVAGLSSLQVSRTGHLALWWPYWLAAVSSAMPVAHYVRYAQQDLGFTAIASSPGALSLVGLAAAWLTDDLARRVGRAEREEPLQRPAGRREDPVAHQA